MFRSLLCATLLALACHADLAAQRPRSADSLVPAYPVSLEGPRFGVTSIFGASERLDSLGVRPLITQFGWQTEKRFYANEEGLSGLTELVVLVGGLEQGLFLPSLSGIVGIRTPRGTEFGVGPNVSLLGLGLVLTGGVTLEVGQLYVPINVAWVPSRDSNRISVLSGFNMEAVSGFFGL
jgi:hypothetical protein